MGRSIGGIFLAKALEQIGKLLEPILLEKNCTLWDIELVKEGPNLFLRIYIDKNPPPVAITDCEAISRALSEKLDILDPITDPYMLEVSSPGIGRTLKSPEHFNMYIGSKIELGLYKAKDSQKIFVGELLSYSEDGNITIKDTDCEIIFNKKDVAIARLYVEF